MEAYKVPLVDELITFLVTEIRKQNSNKLICNNGLYGIARDIDDFYKKELAKENNWNEHEYVNAIKNAIEDLRDHDVIDFKIERNCNENVDNCIDKIKHERYIISLNFDLIIEHLDIPENYELNKTVN